MRIRAALPSAIFRFLPLSILLSAPDVLADTITVSYSATLTVNVSSPNDNWWGQYVNTATQFQIFYPTIRTFITVPVTNMSVTIPFGSTKIDLYTVISVPTGPILGSGNIYPETQFGGSDPKLPHIAPSFAGGTSQAYVTDDEWKQSGSDGPGGSTVTIDSVYLGFGGRIIAPILDPGSNWTGYIGGDGQIVIPFSITRVATFDPPVPEPSTFALLGTGLLGLIGLAHRRLIS